MIIRFVRVVCVSVFSETGPDQFSARVLILYSRHLLAGNWHNVAKYHIMVNNLK